MRVALAKADHEKENLTSQGKPEAHRRYAPSGQRNKLTPLTSITPALNLPT